MGTVWNNYRMWTRKVTGASEHNHGRNHDPRVFDQNFTPTDQVFRARTHKEATRKADKFWNDAELGVGSFMMVIDWKEQKGEQVQNWRDHIEANTGEVSAFIVAEALGLDGIEVYKFADKRHGARFVGGTSVYLIWAEDAEALEASLQPEAV